MSVKPNRAIDFRFKRNENGDFIVVGTRLDAPESLAIPAQVGGKPIVEIADDSFQDVRSLKTVVVLDGVKKIGRNAFDGCSELTEIVLSASVEEIGEGAFADCPSLTRVVLPEGVEQIGFDAFDGCSALTEVVISASVEEIGEGAFDGCSESLRFDVSPKNRRYRSVDGALLSRNAKTLLRGRIDANGVGVIPPGAEKIADRAFAGRSVLTQIVIPESVKKIAFGAFAGCARSTRIDVAPRNADYRTVEGALLTADGETLVRGVVRLDGTGVIPDGVKTIGAQAFSGLESLKRVDFPASLEEIGDWAFSDCWGTVFGDLPRSVETGTCSFPGELAGMPPAPFDSEELEEFETDDSF